MEQKLTKIFLELTEAHLVSVKIVDSEITVIVISKWFELQNREERLEYLTECVQVSYPNLLNKYHISFLAFTLPEARQFQLNILAS